MADKNFEQELADIENQLGLPIPNDQKQKLLARKQEILNNPQYRYAKAHGLPTAKTPNATEIQESNTDYENLANKNIGVLDNTPQAPKENYSDVVNQKAMGATKEDLDYMLENGQISRAAYEKQIAALKTPKVQEEIAEGEKKADETDWDPSERPDNFQLGSKVEIKEGDSAKDANAKKRYNKSMMSIWDAYNNGLIDKETAGYFTVDAIATLAKNLGRGIGNVGAQFTGGSIDQGHDESMWDKRKNEIFSQELQGEAEGIENYTNTMKRYNLNKASTINELLSTVKADVDKLDNDNPAKIAYLALAAQMANGQIDGNTTLAGVGAKAAAPLLEKLEDWFGKGK